MSIVARRGMLDETPFGLPMEHSPDEEFKRKLQLRPSQSAKPASEVASKPATAPKREYDILHSPQYLARQALGLGEFEPHPTFAHLPPHMKAAIEKLDPATQAQVLGVAGCMGAMVDNMRGLSAKISQDMEGVFQQTKKTSLGLRVALRRANKGTLSGQDVARANTLLTHQAEGGAMDPKEAGVSQAHLQGHEMMGAARQMLDWLRQEAGTAGPEQQHALVQVENLVGQLSNEVQQSVQSVQAQFKHTDRERVQLLLQSRTHLAQEAAPALQSSSVGGR